MHRLHPIVGRSLELRCAGLAVLCLLVASPMAASQEQQLDDAIRNATQHVAPAVVRLDMIGGAASGDGEEARIGTAVAVGGQGYLLTASVLLESYPASILVTLPDGQRLSATHVATDHVRHVALLKCARAIEVKPIQTVGAEKLQVGQTVLALGRGLDARSVQLSAGIVSAKNRIWSRAVQTDANISPANYGGPLIDLQGRVAGILVPLSPNDDSPSAGRQWYDSGVGFATEIAPILKRLETLKQGEDLHQGLLGITLAGNNPLVGPVVVGFCPANSPAAQSGIRKGDVIVEIDGRPIDRPNGFKHAIGDRYAGEQVAITVERDGDRKQFSVELAASLPAFQPVTIGIRVALTTSGLAVVDLVPNSPAAEAGVEVGDEVISVDQQPVQNREQLKFAIAAAPLGEACRLELHRGDQNIKVEVSTVARESYIPAAFAPVNQGQASVVEVKLAELPQRCQAVVPPVADQPPALLVWLHSGEPQEAKAIGDRWAKAAAETNTMVLVIETEPGTEWSLDDAEVVDRGMATLAGQHPFDAHRIAIGGGEIASVFAAANVRQFAGVVLDSAGWSDDAAQWQPSPATMLDVLSVAGGLNDADREVLDRVNAPVAQLDRFDAILILRWTAFLDRL